MLPTIPEEMVQGDLARYVELAHHLGAAAAAVVEAPRIAVDDRVRMKCLVPRCPSYERCGNCPPRLPELGQVRAALSAYRWGVVVKLDAATPDDVDRDEAKAMVSESHSRLTEVVCQLESAAFRDGHYLAMGLGAGSCLHALCHDQPCQLLANGECRYPLRARPSMEALGIDVFQVVRLVGWPLYPLGYTRLDPGFTPMASAVGLVLVA